MGKLERLFQPIKIGHLELPNRIIMPAANTNYSFEESDRLANYYAEIARGGLALLTTGSFQSIFPGRRLRRSRINIDNDCYIPKLRKLAKAIKDNGAKAAVQLAAYGYWAKNGWESTAEDVGPSAVVLPREGTNPHYSQAEFLPKLRELTAEEILMIEDQVGDAAVRAKEAGFDAIELQCVGGNLFHRFINPFTNRRTDKYGGSVENRTRMYVETIANIKRRIGDDFPLISRIPGVGMAPWGLNLEAWQEIAAIFEKAGIHMLSIFPGWHESRTLRYQQCVPQGSFVYIAEGIKQAVNIPVATNIQIQDPLLAEQILAEGKADVIAMARPLIADPELPNKAKEGRLEDIRLCTACNHCNDMVGGGQPLSCSVNACWTRTDGYTITPAEKPKKVFVIGGGPAGMEAARVAALRGHQVTLFEKNDRLGGQLLYAVIPPHKDWWNTTVNYLSTQLRKLNVKVRLNTECTAQTIEEGKPHEVIVATGAMPIVPDIRGIDGDNVATAIDVLIGKKAVGQNVVIVGGGLIGCEVAEFLHEKEKKVIILEMLPRIGADMGGLSRLAMVERLNERSIRVETNTKVGEITEKGVKVTRPGSFYEFFEADTVVIAVGMKAVDGLVSELASKVASLRRVGDCVEPKKVREAIETGYLAGLKI